MAKYDVNEVVKQFLQHRYPEDSERADLVKEITEAIASSRAVKLLTVEIGQHAVQNNQNPVQLLQCGMMYGMVLGILLERHYQEAKRKVA